MCFVCVITESMITFVAFVMCLAWPHVLYGSTVAHKAFVNKDKKTRFKTISGGKNSYSKKKHEALAVLSSDHRAIFIFL